MASIPTISVLSLVTKLEQYVELFPTYTSFKDPLYVGKMFVEFKIDSTGTIGQDCKYVGKAVQVFNCIDLVYEGDKANMTLEKHPSMFIPLKSVQLLITTLKEFVNGGFDGEIVYNGSLLNPQAPFAPGVPDKLMFNTIKGIFQETKLVDKPTRQRSIIITMLRQMFAANEPLNNAADLKGYACVAQDIINLNYETLKGFNLWLIKTPKGLRVHQDVQSAVVEVEELYYELKTKKLPMKYEFDDTVYTTKDLFKSHVNHPNIYVFAHEKLENVLSAYIEIELKMHAIINDK